VKVYRLTIADTVEERILDLQEAKRKLANAAIEGGKAIGKLSMKDILALFRRDAEHDHPVDKDDIGLEVERVKMLGYGAERRERVKVPEREKRPEHPVYGRR
jgi:hypothetical protein